MVSRTASKLKGKDIKYRQWSVYEVEMTQNDSTTLSEFDSATALDWATLVKMSDGNEMASSISNNQVTATGVGTDEDCILFVVGLRS